MSEDDEPASLVFEDEICEGKLGLRLDEVWAIGRTGPVRANGTLQVWLFDPRHPEPLRLRSKAASEFAVEALPVLATRDKAERYARKVERVQGAPECRAPGADSVHRHNFTVLVDGNWFDSSVLEKPEELLRDVLRQKPLTLKHPALKALVDRRRRSLEAGRAEAVRPVRPARSEEPRRALTELSQDETKEEFKRRVREERDEDKKREEAREEARRTEARRVEEQRAERKEKREEEKEAPKRVSRAEEAKKRKQRQMIDQLAIERRKLPVRALLPFELGSFEVSVLEAERVGPLTVHRGMITGPLLYKGQGAERAALLRAIYDKGYAFPEWSRREADAILAAFGSFTTLYITKSTPFDHRKEEDLVQEGVRLFAQREPVNIGMKRRYNLSALLALHRGMLREESSESLQYGFYARPGVLPANIAVYCKTPVRFTYKSKEKDVVLHVFNAIGFALDDKKQPDFAWMQKHKAGKKDVVRHFYEMVFLKMFFAVKDQGLRTVVVPGIGLGAFRELYKNDAELMKIWAKAFFKAQRLFPTVEIVIWSEELSDHLTEYQTEHKLAVPTRLLTSKFPAAVMDSKLDLTATLWVNAWDPWSFIGNGNELDNTLDGFFGRVSALLVLGHPFVNSTAHWRYLDAAF